MQSRLRLALVLAAGALAVPSSAAAQEIDGQYIVVLKSQSSDTSVERAKRKVRTHGGKFRHEYGRVVKGFSAKLNRRAVADLREDPAVAFVEPDRVVRLDATQSNATWGLDRLDQRQLPLSGSYSYERTGAGATAYVIDTGMRLSHQEFAGGRMVSGFDAIDGGTADDCNGHGTHVGGTVGGSTYGVAKQVRVVAVRVLDCAGSGTNSGVIAGIDWVTRDHAAGVPAVANMSLGGGASAALDQAVRNSIADGVTYVVAAGNENVDACTTSPARVSEAITVGATTWADARASFSNWGSCLDVFAPGASITSAWHTGDTAASTISGTSMAAPHVAGAAALLLEATPAASPATIAGAIVAGASTGLVTGAGTGSPNRLLHSPPPAPLAAPVASPTPTPTPTPITAPACAAVKYTGTLARTGDANMQPSGTNYQSRYSGVHKGCLQGPAGTDFDLYLFKWNGSSWTQVASSAGLTSTETISYSGTAGYYYWRVASYSGAGSYAFELTRPY